MFKECTNIQNAKKIRRRFMADISISASLNVKLWKYLSFFLSFFFQMIFVKVGFSTLSPSFAKIGQACPLQKIYSNIHADIPANLAIKGEKEGGPIFPHGRKRKRKGGGSQLTFRRGLKCIKQKFQKRPYSRPKTSHTDRHPP